MNCDLVKESLSFYLLGELGHEQEEAMERHLFECARCAEALEAERRMHMAIEQSVELPPPALLASCRRGFFEAIEGGREASALTFGDRLRLWHSMSWVRPVAVLGLLAVGFVGGRMDSWQSGAAPVATRVRYLEPDGTGKVNIVLEETHERRVSGELSDDGIRRLVLAAARDQGDPGLRVESVDLLRRESSAGEVRRALMTALVSDPNPGVRIKALDGLRQHSSDPEVQRALSQVLLRDDNPGLRAQAIDLLVEHRRKDMVGVLQQLMQREDNDYVRLRTQRVLAEMNASVDAF
jgi:hypothetical protein